MRKGFTLLELLIVVIVIAILATFAIPQYMTAVERAKVAKAKHALGLIAQAEKMYRAEWDSYTGVNDGGFGNHSLSTYTELGDLDNDPDWAYDVTAGDDYFVAKATREGTSTYNNKEITLNELGEWCTNTTNVHPLAGYKGKGNQTQQ